MANREDIERAKRGAKAWNDWADAELAAGRHPSVDFSLAHLKDMDFSGFRFPGLANFNDAVFKVALFSASTFMGQVFFDSAKIEGAAFFDRATFQGPAQFMVTTFMHDVDFNFATFEDIALFTATFERDVSFLSASFKALVAFDGSVMASPPDFLSTSFALPPRFHGAHVGYGAVAGGIWQRALKRAPDLRTAAHYRHLKKLASDAKDHESEVRFFALELRAKRFHETKGFWPIAANFAYDVLSDFGVSIARPLIALGLLTTLGTAVIVGAYGVLANFTISKLVAAAVLAATNAMLLVGSDKWLLRSEAFKVLTGGTDQKTLGLVGESFAYAQSCLSLVLFFLVGLALRNRFRLGGGG